MALLSAQEEAAKAGPLTRLCRMCPCNFPVPTNSPSKRDCSPECHRAYTDLIRDLGRQTFAINPDKYRVRCEHTPG